MLQLGLTRVRLFYPKKKESQQQQTVSSMYRIEGSLDFFKGTIQNLIIKFNMQKIKM